jgi:hypothetical protein
MYVLCFAVYLDIAKIHEVFKWIFYTLQEKVKLKRNLLINILFMHFTRYPVVFNGISFPSRANRQRICLYFPVLKDIKHLLDSVFNSVHLLKP